MTNLHFTVAEDKYIKCDACMKDCPRGGSVKKTERISPMVLSNSNVFPYSADLTAGSLKVAESRIVADLLLRGIDEKIWKQRIQIENVLQTRTPATARRLGRLIRNRLETMSLGLWKLVRDGHLVVATHACLAATVKQSRLVADFFDFVLREQYQRFAVVLDRHLWNDFIENAYIRFQIEPTERPVWTETTVRRLRSSLFQILEQAGYVENTRTLRLRNVFIADEVVRCLQNNDESTVLRCIQLTPDH